MSDLLFKEITSSILDSYFAVYNSTARKSLNEQSLKRAMLIELNKRGLRIRQNMGITLHYADRKIGSGLIDLVVDGKIAVQVKCLKKLREADEAQLKAYLLEGKLAVGLLLNFGSNQPDYRRIFEPRHAPSPADGAQSGSGSGE